MPILCRILMSTLCFMLLLTLPGKALSYEVPFKTIDKGEISFYRYGDPDFAGAVMDIRDWGSWVWFWRMHTKGIQPVRPVPRVDFQREMVLVAILGYQTSGGGPSIEIVSIEDLPLLWIAQGRSVRVQIEENRDPGLLTVITNPYHIVRARIKTGSTVIFERHSLVTGCEDDRDCDENSFCLFDEGKCVGPGVCTPKPDICPMTLVAEPVCGCDGKTYGNACEAYREAVSILHQGECRKLSNANVDAPR